MQELIMQHMQQNAQIVFLMWKEHSAYHMLFLCCQYICADQNGSPFFGPRYLSILAYYKSP